MAISDGAKTCLDRINALNADNQRTVRINIGIIKAARSEILAHVAINGKSVMTDLVLNVLNNAIKEGR